MRLLQVFVCIAIAKALWIIKEVSAQGEYRCSPPQNAWIDKPSLTVAGRQWTTVASVDDCCEKCYAVEKCVAYTIRQNTDRNRLSDENFVCWLTEYVSPFKIRNDDVWTGFVTRSTTATTSTASTREMSTTSTTTTTSTASTREMSTTLKTTTNTETPEEQKDDTRLITQEKAEKDMPTWAIIGLVLLFVIAVLLLIIVVLVRKKNKHGKPSSNTPTERSVADKPQMSSDQTYGSASFETASMHTSSEPMSLDERTEVSETIKM